MRRVLGTLLLAALPLGCASTARVPETPQTATTEMRYSIGSISKQFTAAAILLLQEQGKLSLNDKVAKFIPDLTRANEVVAQADPSRLGSEQQEMLSGLKDFISKAGEALRARDVPRAQVLAGKASRLAEDLALALKNSKATR